MTDGSVTARLVVGDGVRAAAVMVDGAVVDGVARGCGDRACRAETWVIARVPEAESAGERSRRAVFVVGAEGTVALVGTPAALPSSTGGSTPASPPVEPPAGVGGAAVAGAVGAVRCPSRWPGVAEPLAGGPLVGLDNPPGVVGMTVALRPCWEALLESTLARVASMGLRGPVCDAELVPTAAREAEAAFDALIEVVVAATAAFDALIEVVVAATAAFAQRQKASGLAVTTRPKN